MVLLKKFGMSNCTPAKTPMNVNEKLVVVDGTGATDERSFRSIVGGLLYLTHTRPDIMFSVSIISRFMQNPSKHHLGAAKRIMRYIQGTLDYGIQYTQVTNFKLISFSDSDWAGCIDDRKSTTGYVFSLGSGVISWTSKKQLTTAFSSTEAEYIAATTTACQAIWLRRILCDLKEKQEEAKQMFCDNKSTIAISKNPVHQGRTKHIEIQHHFIREVVATEQVQLEHCNTEEQMADIFTKALPDEKFQKFRDMMGVQPQV